MPISFCALSMALRGFAKRGTRRQIEGNGDDGKLSLVVDGQRAALHFEPREGAEGNCTAIHRRYGRWDWRSRNWQQCSVEAEGLGAAEEAELPEDVVAVTVPVLEEPVVSAVGAKAERT